METMLLLLALVIGLLGAVSLQGYLPGEGGGDDGDGGDGAPEGDMFERSAVDEQEGGAEEFVPLDDGTQEEQAGPQDSPGETLLRSLMTQNDNTARMLGQLAQGLAAITSHLTQASNGGQPQQFVSALDQPADRYFRHLDEMVADPNERQGLVKALTPIVEQIRADVRDEFRQRDASLQQDRVSNRKQSLESQVENAIGQLNQEFKADVYSRAELLERMALNPHMTVAQHAQALRQEKLRAFKQAGFALRRKAEPAPVPSGRSGQRVGALSFRDIGKIDDPDAALNALVERSMMDHFGPGKR